MSLEDMQRTSRRLAEGVTAGNLAAIQAASDPEIEFTSRFAAVEGRSYRGHAGWADYLADAVAFLLAEGERTPRLMTVSLHCRLAARPGRMTGLLRFLESVRGDKRIWICRRSDLARHWLERFGR